MKSNERIRAVVMMAGACGLLGAALSGGCVGYASYPPVDGATMAVNNPNAPPTDTLMTQSLRWLVDKYPPQTGGPAIAGEKYFAINLPKGVRKSTYERVAERVSPAAVPLTAENYTQLPIYHVAQLWVRSRVAKVTVLRPRQELGLNSKGQPAYEGITLHMEGGFQPWRVVRWQTWEIGVIDTPELYFCPTSEWPEKIRPVRESPAEPQAQPEETVPPFAPGQSQEPN
jgi:hypothetical protein